MDIIRFTITNPVKVAVGVLLLCLFGLLALFQIPIQLTPNVDEPRITITTRWTGKSAQEVEREIIERQEQKLKGINGLRKMTSTSQEGLGEITLKFYVGTDKNRALRDVDEKINQVSGYPDEVEEPEVVAADAALESPIAWILFKAEPGNDMDVTTYRDFVWDEVRPILERVDGLSSIDVYGGREREVQVLVDPARLAARGLTLRELEAALVTQNIDTSAGTRAVGKRDFVYRAVGQYEDTEAILDTVIANRTGGPVYVRDVARVLRTHEKERNRVWTKGQKVLGIPAFRETGANVMEVMAGLKEAIETVNRDVFASRGMKVSLDQVYDETTYIESAIDLVRSNLIFGGALAVIVLLAFLRSGRATAIVALSIPISVMGTFLAISLLGRNLNVVMLSGMAFAVGMVVDNAVVVLENIYRHRQMGKSAFTAALEGASEVWGAILASTLTTLAVFIPVIFIQEEAGQLFRDIAIAISAGVAISLVVAVMVIPTVSARVLTGESSKVAAKLGKLGHVGALARFPTWMADLVTWINRSLPLRLAVIAVFMVGSLLGSWWLMPPADYLPTGNRNFVIGFIITEPGLSVQEYAKINQDIDTFLRPYYTAEPGSPEAQKLPPVKMTALGREIDVQPSPIDNFFLGTFRNMCFMGLTSRDELNVKPLTVLATMAAASSERTVGAIPFFFQTGLFGEHGGGNTVDVEMRGADLNKVIAAAGAMFGACMQSGVGQARPDPLNFDLLRPEIRGFPDRVKAAEVGLNTADLGFALAAAVDGAYVGEFQEAGDKIDLKVKFENSDGTPIVDVQNLPICTPTGKVVPMSAVVDFREVGAPEQINHIEEMPGIRLELQPASGMAIETVVEKLEEKVAELRQAGAIDPSVYVSMAGNADKLVETRAAMFGKWTGLNGSSLLALIQSRGFLALLVVYLLMAALFESFIYPLAIMLTVPLALVGGFGGLRLVHWLSLRDPVSPIQQMDVVTMLGFVILVGIVVNNAILIVHQALNNLRAGMEPTAALHESVRTRIRPIFMTAFTSVGGMLPLALMAGAGSELYRGLAAVMVGGLVVATVFTTILIPVVFSMFLTMRQWLMRVLGREAQLAEMAGFAAAASDSHGYVETTTASNSRPASGSSEPLSVSSDD